MAVGRENNPDGHSGRSERRGAPKFTLSINLSLVILKIDVDFTTAFGKCQVCCGNENPREYENP